jgi:hypothetical protein
VGDKVGVGGTGVAGGEGTAVTVGCWIVEVAVQAGKTRANNRTQRKKSTGCLLISSPFLQWSGLQKPSYQTLAVKTGQKTGAKPALS